MAALSPPSDNVIASKLASARGYKEEGNEFFKTGEYKKAAGKYHRSILYLKGIDNDLYGTPEYLKVASVHPESKKRISPELETQCIALNIDVYNNLAASLLKLPNPDFQRVIKYSDIVLELDDKNQKALFRKGQAALRSKNFDTAKHCLAEIRVKDEVIKRLLKECDLGIEKAVQKEKAMYKNMFQ